MTSNTNENYKELRSRLIEWNQLELIFGWLQEVPHELPADYKRFNYLIGARDILSRLAMHCLDNQRLSADGSSDELLDLRAVDVELRLWIDLSAEQGVYPDRMLLDELMRSAITTLLCGETELLNKLIPWWEQHIETANLPLMKRLLVGRYERARYFLGV